MQRCGITPGVRQSGHAEAHQGPRQVDEARAPWPKVEAAFPFACLVDPMTLNEPYDATNPAHAVDVVIVAAWFMLREKELAAARLGDVEVQGNSIALCLPLHKTAQGGQQELTRRQLQCACRAVFLPTCLVHAAIRHLRRLRLAGHEAREAPFAPKADGTTSSRADNVDLIRGLLTAADVPVTLTDPTAATPAGWRAHSSWRRRACLSPPRRGAVHSSCTSGPGTGRPGAGTTRPSRRWTPTARG